MTDGRKIPAPTVSVETQAFWNAAREGRFIVPACTACGRAHWYPRAICPFCSSGEIVWRDASGSARGAEIRRTREALSAAGC